ncbi:MAG: ATP-dependent Clp protease ATP-binding subunit ClpX [Calditrichaeota bacterium]|nr:ATP-dependent Clp protease ATP-binding subunit ClpX [Calditrichota bacterium]
MADRKGKLPSPEEMQRDIQQFLKDKYGVETAQAEVDMLGTRESETAPEHEEPDLHFEMTPRELEAYLRQYVVQQDDAVEVLATKIATHFNRMRWEREDGRSWPVIPGQIKPNVLMIGPTGVGKTYIVKLIADRLGVPFVKGDATKFSETGYVGGDVEDLVRDLVRVAKGNIKHAEYGIIYIDEIDKIAASPSVAGPDVSRTGVQRNLLKLMEETEVELRVPHDLASQMEAVMETQRTGKAPQKKVNTKNILFIVAGAFNGLDDIIRRRLNRQPIGFGGDVDTKVRDRDDLLANVSTQDLIEYGFESEFIGRLPVLARLTDLNVDGLLEVLANPYNAVVQGKIRDFAAYGIDLTFDERALQLLAERAYEEKTGARGLTRVAERALIPFEKQLPSTSVRELMLTEHAVRDPGAVCERLVFDATIRSAVLQFKEETGVILSLSKAAKNWLAEHADGHKTPGELLLSRFAGLHYAFNLLERESVNVTRSMLAQPRDTLEGMIRKNYRPRE